MERIAYDGANRGQLREALAAFGLAPNKGLGQNFLCDGNACDAIVALAGDLSQKSVLEIGPGAGALTGRLCAAARGGTAGGGPGVPLRHPSRSWGRLLSAACLPHRLGTRIVD